MKVSKPSTETVIKTKIQSLKNYIRGLLRHSKTSGSDIKLTCTRCKLNTEQFNLSVENEIKSLRTDVESIKQQLNKRQVTQTADYAFRGYY